MRLSFHQIKHSKMVAMVGAEEYVGVVEHAHSADGLMHFGNRIIQREKGEESAAVEQIYEISFVLV